MSTYFAVTTPGLESFTAVELAEILKDRGPVSILPGGVEFRAGLAELYRANLHLRTANRLLARLGMPFLARDFPELQAKASRLPWERFLEPGQPVAMRVTCHRSRLMHSDAVARTVAASLAMRLGQPSLVVKPAEESDHPAQLIVVRLAGDRCTVSLDSSGTILHKRGYRLASAKAPLRETLAAAMLMASGWDKNAPLLDPFCGSGTIPIEAARMALGIPPGRDRSFAFMHWPGFDRPLWDSVLAAATQPSPNARSRKPRLLASDRNAGAIRIARQNAARAGVEECIEFTCQAVSSIQPPPEAGWIVTNPPYGQRLDQGKDLRNLYAQLGNVLAAKCPGWQVTVLCSHLALLGQMRLDLDASLGFVSGGIKVRLARGKIT